MQKIRIGSRSSWLAKQQTKEVQKKLDNSDSEVVFFRTSGDIDKTTPIDQVEGSDFFTDVIEAALLKNEIDLAVHSAKDLPDQTHKDLEIALVTESIDPDDVLVSRKNIKLADLPSGARIGTSSQSRKEQVLRLRPDILVLDLRGNVEFRLERLVNGEFDAIILAAAGLIRLGMEKRITERLPFRTAAGQGSLALQIRKKNKDLKRWLKEKFI